MTTRGEYFYYLKESIGLLKGNAGERRNAEVLLVDFLRDLWEKDEWEKEDEQVVTEDEAVETALD